MKHYRAPWSVSLIVVSSLATVICLGGAVILLTRRGPVLPWLAPLPALLPAIAALFAIRGYSLAPGVILVHRPLWTTRLPLAGLESARAEPDAMRRSIRLCGNGGLFSFTGWFRNKPLGIYRAFVTDPAQTVVLRLPKRTVVLSPAPPEAFVRELLASLPPG